MNKELMCDENFIRCSTMIAELLMKYKNKEYEESEESKADSSPYCEKQSKPPAMPGEGKSFSGERSRQEKSTLLK